MLVSRRTASTPLDGPMRDQQVFLRKFAAKGHRKLGDAFRARTVMGNSLEISRKFPGEKAFHPLPKCLLLVCPLKVHMLPCWKLRAAQPGVHTGSGKSTTC